MKRLIATLALAAPLMAHADICDDYANIGRAAALDRDEGVSLSFDQSQIVRSAMPEYMKRTGLMLLEQVYAHPRLPPEGAYDAVMEVCRKKQAQIARERRQSY